MVLKKIIIGIVILFTCLGFCFGVSYLKGRYDTAEVNGAIELPEMMELVTRPQEIASWRVGEEEWIQHSSNILHAYAEMNRVRISRLYSDGRLQTMVIDRATLGRVMGTPMKVDDVADFVPTTTVMVDATAARNIINQARQLHLEKYSGYYSLREIGWDDPNYNPSDSPPDGPLNRLAEAIAWQLDGQQGRIDYTKFHALPVGNKVNVLIQSVATESWGTIQDELSAIARRQYEAGFRPEP